MYIDPKDLSLQDAAGMQLANVIRGIPEGGGSGADGILLCPVNPLTKTTIQATKTAQELHEADYIVFVLTNAENGAKVFSPCLQIIKNSSDGSYIFTTNWGNGYAENGNSYPTWTSN